MIPTATHKGFSARANTVVVFHDGEGSQALVTAITCKANGHSKGLELCGPGKFTGKVESHINQTVVPLLADLLASLDLSLPGFQLSAVNLGAASWDQRSVEISGYSADTPIFLAMLAAVLGLNPSEDFLCTGHIASIDGDIRMVGFLAEKLAAATDEPSIKRFAHPDPMGDGSLDHMLDPGEIQALQAALAAAKQSLLLNPLKDVADLIEAAFSQEQLVLSSLWNGYFGNTGSEYDSASPLKRATDHLLTGLSGRFWSTLETGLLAGRDDKAKILLNAYISFHLAKEQYPRNFGSRLKGILSSIPASTRRLKLGFPLISSTKAFELTRFAKNEDHPDAVTMLKVLNGEVGRTDRTYEPLQKNSCGPSCVSYQTLDNVISTINKEALAQKIGIPLDSARASYSLDSVLVDSHEEFNDLVDSFVLHLMRRLRGLEMNMPAGSSNAESFALLERAFARDGGVKGAMLEAQTGVKGGMRYVLDALTEQFKKEEREKEINRVLLEALDPLDWESQVAFIKALMERLRGHLPEDIKNQPPERYANHLHLLARAYAESIDQLSHTFKML